MELDHASKNIKQELLLQEEINNHFFGLTQVQ